jgi:predicted glycoside hydrolase/deacetylase ChbG (UPF0249 family)
MVFMRDSERAAVLAREYGIDSGLHLNFTEAFTGNVKSRALVEAQLRVASFLRVSKWSQLLYNPIRRRDFRCVYNAQVEEYVRLYDCEPTHTNGHHHMHLCMNMLVDRLIPAGSAVRRSFAFCRDEKGVMNRLYRRLVNAIVVRRYTCTQYFFSIPSPHCTERLRYIVNLARSGDVEVMVHPERAEEFTFLLTDVYREIIGGSDRGSYAAL